MPSETASITPNATDYTSFVERYATINGFQLYYEFEGDHLPPHYGKPAVVLVHGWTANRLRLHPLLLSFKRLGYPVFRLDLRGHGWSQKEGISSFTIDDFAADVSQFIRTVVQEGQQFSKVILCGHSLGGSVCMKVALHLQGTISHLILIATSGYWCDQPFSRLKLWVYTRLYRRQFWKLYNAKKPGHAVHGLEHFPMWSDVYNTKGRTLFTGYEATIQSLESMIRFDLRAQLPQLGVPTLILAGEEDDGAPARHSRLLNRLIPDSELHVLAGANHDVVIAKPITAEGIIAQFLKTYP